MKAQRFASLFNGRLTATSRACGLLAAALLSIATTGPASAQTLDRIRGSQRITLGYVADAAPFTFSDGGAAADGYGVAVCQRIVERIRTAVGAPSLTINWVAVSPAAGFREVQQGNIDLLCTPASETLTRRGQVAFSIPVFAGGVRAFLRANAPLALREALQENAPTRPVWRGSPAAKTLEATIFGVVSNTTAESWLAGRLQTFQLGAMVVPVPDYRTGVQQLEDGGIDVLFGELSLVLGVTELRTLGELQMIDRLFTHEQFGLALARNDDDFRLLVDRALSELYASAELAELYTTWFGEMGDRVQTFFMWTTLAE